MVAATPNGISFKTSAARFSPGAAKSRLIVLSNRAPIRIIKEHGRQHIEPTVGGVGTTFLRLLENSGGVWIAWSGSKTNPGRVWMPPGENRFEMLFPTLSERDISFYYHGTCNRALWPLMHLMPQNCYFDALNWDYYKRVNRNFANTTAAEARPGDLIWVQDFHLAGVPAYLRERGIQNPIGLFWHVPFPPEEIFRIFPWRNELLTGMLGCDLIGFHTPAYAADFLDCCEKVLGVRVDRHRGCVFAADRVVTVGSFPLGIPADYFESLAGTEKVRERSIKIRRGLRTPTMILGVDRLDYTKGILERLLGYERFLEVNPEFRRQVTFVQIAVPSRTKVADYQRLKRQLDEQVGHILGRFSSEGVMPIRYLYTQFGAEELVAYYQAADIALLTPLRDGMNLVAKEFVASRLRNDGVLILSEFAGAANELTEALMVNPYSVDQISERLRQAVEMPPQERTQRMVRLREKVRGNNLEQWSATFLAALEASSTSQPANARAAAN